MPAPKTAVWSVRLKPELRKRIQAYAADQNITVNAAAIQLWEMGFEAAMPPLAPRSFGPEVEKAKPRHILAIAEAKAAHLGADTIRAPKAPRSRWNLKSVQVGPTPHAPGSLVKTKARKA